MTPIDALILLLKDFQRLAPLAQLSAAAGCISALSGSIFWAWRKGRKYVAQLVETNGKLRQELKDSTIRRREIERRIEEHRRTLAILQAQVPAAVLAHAAADKAHAREILSELFDQLAPAVATSCQEGTPAASSSVPSGAAAGSGSADFLMFEQRTASRRLRDISCRAACRFPGKPTRRRRSTVR